MKIGLDLLVLAITVAVIALRPGANSLFSYLFLGAVGVALVVHLRALRRGYRDLGPDRAVAAASWRARGVLWLGWASVASSIVGIVVFILRFRQGASHGGTQDAFLPMMFLMGGICLRNLALKWSRREGPQGAAQPGALVSPAVTAPSASVPTVSPASQPPAPVVTRR